MAVSPAPVDRAAILDLVRTAGGVTAAEVADHAGLPVSTIRDHLDALVAAGLLAKARASGGLPYRPAWRYRAVTDDPTSSAYGRLLTAVLEHLGDEAADRAVADRVGRRWGGLLAGARDDDRDPVEALVAVLDALGFTPRVAAGGDTTEVWLRSCPYLGLVRDHPDAMCRLHAGVIRGALHHSGADDDAVLEPFAAPEGCVVRLRAAGPDPA
ncbi:helix-turn-helix domain-containing protein [Couchioplanes caeruleus]|uniref:helix-turn-helix transcriptional regulator n=1 Tax=Couchioplanes caeruleus TaxID=56438 RepID=UPI0020BDA283|nr:helix-turn-helix domain-containing protein [Couchioplanes caeruleus]UQU61803.1 helix-turn-helix domain-containing protein [Couchioplanes caeruleus]